MLAGRPGERLMGLLRLPSLLLIAFIIAAAAFAHPEDEFCADMDGMDPALCRALAEVDSADSSVDLALEDRSAAEVFSLYVSNGVKHILPGGLDHILFVLALFLASTRLGALFWQISAFTLAHTITLGLAASGVIAPPPDIVEPLIAASIAFVAVENILFKDMQRWRPLIVFGFGLLHGLGFAGFLIETGLPDGQLWPALIGFNIGVELGQISVVLAAFGLVYAARKAFQISQPLYRKTVVLPASALIALTGLVWTIQRLI